MTFLSDFLSQTSTRIRCGSTLRQGVVEVKRRGDLETSVDESWFRLHKTLLLKDIFPCTVVMAAADQDGKKIACTLLGIAP